MGKHSMQSMSRVMHDIQRMTLDQLEEHYDIEIDDDGAVWDNCEGKLFPSLTEWGRSVGELNAYQPDDEEDYPVKTNNRRHRDDDY